jgi:hypothetical protein
MLAASGSSEPPKFNLHILGGDQAAVRAGNSTRSIEEEYTWPIEIVCRNLSDPPLSTFFLR